MCIEGSGGIFTSIEAVISLYPSLIQRELTVFAHIHPLVYILRDKLDLGLCGCEKWSSLSAKSVAELELSGEIKIYSS